MGIRQLTEGGDVVTQEASHAAGDKASDVFREVEESLEPGPVRDLWWALRSSLRDEGPSGVETYLQSEFTRRLKELELGIAEVETRLAEMN